MIGLDAQLRTLRRLQPLAVIGRVDGLRGLTVLVRDLPVPAGSLVRIERIGVAAHPSRWSDPAAGAHPDDGGEALGEVVGFDGRHAAVMMLCSTSGIRAGDPVHALHPTQTVGVGDALLGRVIDGLGRPIDARGPIHGLSPREIDPEPISALRRRRINQPMLTGVRAIDLFTTLGRGQRMGVFAGPGVGKSTLLGAVARQASSDVSVIALIGERGREVRDFLEQNLGPDGLARSVVVVATGDESPLLRVRAALTACAAAEHFRDRGKAVMLIMDSVTRFAHAQRQIGLSVGEPPATRGYTPSVFASLARLLERAGALEASNTGDPTSPAAGSITGLYAILVEGDDMTEPVADAARGILDGHLILARSLAQRAHYPAIDILDSVSRVADEVCDPAHIAARRQLIRLLAAHRKIEDLVQIGAYAKGSNLEADVAIRFVEPINELLRQDLRQPDPFDGPTGSRARAVKLAVDAGSLLAGIGQKPAGGTSGGGGGGGKK